MDWDAVELPMPGGEGDSGEESAAGSARGSIPLIDVDGSATPRAGDAFTTLPEGIVSAFVSEDYSRLSMDTQNAVVAAVLIHVRQGGALVAVPIETFTSEEVRAAEESGYSGELGPVLTVRVRTQSVRDRLRAGRGAAAVQIADISGSMLNSLLPFEPVTGDVGPFVDASGNPVWPYGPDLRAAVDHWVEAAQEVPLASGYVTAASAAGSVAAPRGGAALVHAAQPGGAAGLSRGAVSPGPPQLRHEDVSTMHALLQQLAGGQQALLERVGALERDPPRNVAQGRAPPPRAGSTHALADGGPTTGHFGGGQPLPAPLAARAYAPMPGSAAPAGGSRDAPAVHSPPGLARGSLAPPAPQLFAAEAARVGISDEQLAALLSVAGTGPPRLAERSPALPAPRAAPTARQGGAPGEFAEDEPGAGARDGYAGLADADVHSRLLDASPEQALRWALLTMARQQEAMTRHAALTAPHHHADPFARLSSSAPGEADDGRATTGARGCAAREAFLEAMRRHPDRLLDLFRRKLAASAETTPEDLQPAALRGHFERRSPLGTHKLLTYVAYLSAHHWELAESLRRAVASLPSEARSKIEPGLDSLQAAIALQAAFVDQSAMDGGRYGLSWLLVGLPQPPFATIRQHVERQGEEPFSPLVDPRWIAANMAYLRDLGYLVQRQATMASTAPIGAASTTAASPSASPAPAASASGPQNPRPPRRAKAKAKAGSAPPGAATE